MSGRAASRPGRRRCASGPPRERGAFRTPDLVELTVLDPALTLDIRYATADNFLGRPVYDEARAFLQRPAAEALAVDLEAAGVRVLFDDREGVSPGVKFKDAELIGVPTIVVVGRGLADGTIEVKDRRSGERREVAVGSAVDEILAEIGRS